jgi:hypothetical protein
MHPPSLPSSSSPPRCIGFPPPLIVIVPTLIRLAVLVLDVLGKALAPLRGCWVAEPELLLGGVGGVRAHAADKDCLLCAGFVFASPLRATIPLALLLDCHPDHRRRGRGGILTRRQSPRHATILLVIDELVRESSKELEAAHCPVVCADDLLKKKVGVDANDAEDTEVEPLVPMFGAEIAVQLQLIGS